MFVKLRLAYTALFLMAGLTFGMALAFGILPFSAYVTDFVSLGKLRRMVAAWVFPPMVWTGLVALNLTRKQVRRPTRTFLRVLKKHRHWLGRGAVFVLLMLPLGKGIMAFKQAIPSFVPFYADPFIANAERALFGVDPWRITHALFGHAGTIFFDRIYALWFVIMMLLFGWLCFTRDQKFQVRGLLTYVGSWAVLGNLLALGLSSVGPCFYGHFYGDPRFDGLMVSLHGTHAQTKLFAVNGMEYLLKSEGKFSLGAGISAMPSLHVAIAWLVLLCTLTQSRSRALKILASAYAVSIFVGSVHLGWHYALDGIVSIVVVTALWIGSGRFVEWVHRRETAGTGSEIPQPAAAPGLAEVAT